jgi:mono/diheme cytochrome c family protein
MKRFRLACFCLAVSFAASVVVQITDAKPVRCETSKSASENTPGKLEYQRACARCHGDDGKGPAATAATSTAKTKDLTLLARDNGGVFPERKILRVIHDTEPIAAHGPREEPVWGKRFSLRLNVATGASNLPGSSAQIDYRVKQLTQYLKSIQEK